MAIDFSLAGKTAIVTGASQGLGRSIALGLAAAGAEVVLAARNGERLRAVAAEAAAAGHTALPVECDVTQQPQVVALVGAALERFGRLDVLVNNAGISPYYKRAELLQPEEWCEVLDTNLTGAFRCVLAAAQALFASRGSVINISSIAGSHGAERLAAYAAAKGGLDALTRSLAIEWAPRGVRVNAVAPAFLDTPMTQGIQANAQLYQHLLSRSPSGRFGLPQEVVGAVIFLASPAASFITGQILPIDGGWTAH